MANSSLAFRSSLNLRSIRKSLSGLGESVRTAQSSASNITTSIRESNRNKKKSLSLSSTLFRRRREATLRKEREDILEAGSVSGSVKRAGKVVMNSTKGFLGRILDYLGTVLIGWAINNLPKIIDLAEKLIKRMQKYFSILSDFTGGVFQILTGFGELIGGVATSIATFNFGNIKSVFDSSIAKMQTGFNRMLTNTVKSLNMLTDDASTMLRKMGFDIGDFEIPELKLEPEPDITDPGAPEPAAPEPAAPEPRSSGSAGGGTRSSNPLLQLISGAEGAYDSMYPSQRYPQMLDMSMTELVQFQKMKLRDGRASAAVGAYQFLYPEQYVTLAGLTMNDKFSPENQDKLALAFLKARGVTVEGFKKDRVGTALKLAQGFAGIPVLAPVYSSFAGRIVKRGESFYQGYKGNRATISADRVEKSIDRLIGPAPKTKQTPQPKPQPQTQQNKPAGSFAEQLINIFKPAPKQSSNILDPKNATARGKNKVVVVTVNGSGGGGPSRPVTNTGGGGGMMIASGSGVNRTWDKMQFTALS